MWDHLDQLVRNGKLKQLLHHSSGQAEQTDSDPRRDASLRPLMGTINVIFADLKRTDSCPSKMMSVTRLPAEDSNLELKRARIDIQPVLGFSDEDKIRTVRF